jgi:hypothetical protein
MQPLANPFAGDHGAPVPFNPFGPPDTQSPFAAAPTPAHFDPFASPPPANGIPLPAGSISPEVVTELKMIARQRLQRSGARVEAMLDDVTTLNRPLDDVLAEIRGLVIRGVMQSTLDEVVDEMTVRVRQLAG